MTFVFVVFNDACRFHFFSMQLFTTHYVIYISYENCFPAKPKKIDFDRKSQKKFHSFELFYFKTF